MQTQEALDQFLKNCDERGLAAETRRTYESYLRHFATEHPELPTDTKIIERFLQKRKETPARRGPMFKKLQAFYSYLEEHEGIKSPVPSKGRVGRPRKQKIVITQPQVTLDTQLDSSPKKISYGGLSLSSSTSISTREACDRFLKDRQRRGLTPESIKDYANVCRRLVEKFEELPRDPEVIGDYLLSISGTPENRHFHFRGLSALYHFLFPGREGADFVDAFRVRRPKRKLRKILNTEEYQRFLSLPFNPMEKAMVYLLADTQIRASELCSLTRENVYPDHIIIQGKTGQREVPISPEVYALLVQLAPSGPLFHTSRGPMNRNHIYDWVRKRLEGIGVKGIKMGPHTLRHSGAVQYLMFGGDTESLRQKLGHTKLDTTQIYATMLPGQVQQRHREVGLLGHLTGSSSLARAICYCCNYEHQLIPDKAKEIRCPGCGAVGLWYLPDTKLEEVQR